MMNRLYLPLAGLLAVVLISGCTSTQLGNLAEVGALAAGRSPEEAQQYGHAASSFGQALLPIDYQEERAIGGGVAVKAFQEFGPYYNDPVMERYVTLVGKAVGYASDRPDLPYAFAILDNNTPNAFSGPGGYIFITIGTLKNCQDEAELAGVLGHEIGHVCARHALKTLQRAKLFEGIAEGASLSDPKYSAQYGNMVNALDDTLFKKGFDQSFEYQADQLGTEYAARTGYNPWGLRDFLVRLQALLPTGISGGWFQTHPPVGERIQRLNAYLNKNFTDYRSLPRLADRFRLNVTDRLKAAGR